MKLLRCHKLNMNFSKQSRKAENIKFKGIILFVSGFLLIVLFSCDISVKREMPFVYDVENTGFDCPVPQMPAFDELPAIESLPDPFIWSDGSGRIKTRDDWRIRRAEIASEIQHYELGTKPAPPENIKATFSDGQLNVIIEKNGKTLELNATINLPEGEGPFPAIIGIGRGSGSLPQEIFTSRGIATVSYNERQLTSGRSYGEGAFFELYPDTTVGSFAAWTWGVSRIIDGLELAAEAGINISRLAITGCSYAGKIALYSGAFDERIALTISQEPGGGGDASWRYSDFIQKNMPEGEKAENLAHAQGVAWYHYNLRKFNDASSKLPYDHHELLAMVAPRALLVFGNPDFPYLADESGYVSCMAASEVWKALGIPDRFGFSKAGGHGHCQLPESQKPELVAFVEKFLLGNKEMNTNISKSPYNTDLSRWITWDTPELK